MNPIIPSSRLNVGSQLARVVFREREMALLASNHVSLLITEKKDGYYDIQ